MDKWIHERRTPLSIELLQLPQLSALFGDILIPMSAHVTVPALQVLFTRQQIADRVAEIGREIDRAT